MSRKGSHNPHLKHLRCATRQRHRCPVTVLLYCSCGEHPGSQHLTATILRSSLQLLTCSRPAQASSTRGKRTAATTVCAHRNLHAPHRRATSGASIGRATASEPPTLPASAPCTRSPCSLSSLRWRSSTPACEVRPQQGLASASACWCPPHLCRVQAHGQHALRVRVLGVVAGLTYGRVPCHLLVCEVLPMVAHNAKPI